MFKKPFIQKSSCMLKKTDRKNLRNRVKSSFALGDDIVERILPRKQEIAITRIQTQQEINVTVYSVDKRAMLFEFYPEKEGKRLVPTVYLLWQLPELVYTFTVHEGVPDYIFTGANLMMPGVHKSPPREPITYFLYNQIASIITIANKSPVAVGLTAIAGNSSMGGQQGRALTVLHYYNDYLCRLHDMPMLTIPKLRFIVDDIPDSLQYVLDDVAWPVLGEAAQQNVPQAEDETDVPEIIRVLSLEEAVDTTEEDAAASKPAVAIEPHVAMNEALQRCFIIVAKYSPTLQLPQLLSSFYKKEMIEMMSDQQLDIKVSSYRKVSEFLKAMQKEGLCKLGQKQKGVDTVEEIYYAHERIANFYLPVEFRPRVIEDACIKNSIKVSDSYVVVPEVVDIFLPKYRVGAKVTMSEAKKTLLDYIKKNGLQDIEREHTLARTAVLQRLCIPGTTRVSNDELMHTVLYLMDSCPIKLKCGSCTSASSTCDQVHPCRSIRMQIQMHNGKTVTVVSNVHEFHNVHLPTFVKEIRHLAATSAILVKDTRQVQAQGNQIEIISSLLNKKYGISKSKMVGLEFAPKPKKCTH